ncbi:MAG: FecR domain-containing protein [Dechloromonas sp.]|nr:FecR domain-containing protein [Dechloromonas sp.]
MIHLNRLPLAVLLGALVGANALAGEQVGMVKTVRGQVSIERGSERMPAIVGVPLQQNDRVRTGDNASVGVTLRDNTLLSAGPRSLIVIDKFAYDSTTNVGAMSVGIRRGTLAVATGKIAKATPESVDFHTPTSVLGVRGTEFVVEVDGGSDE